LEPQNIVRARDKLDWDWKGRTSVGRLADSTTDSSCILARSMLNTPDQ
jgi:hypothetical protein